MTIFKEMFIANVKELIRDRDGLFWLLAFPVIFIFIFGIVFSGTDESTFNIGIVTQSENIMIKQMIEGISDIQTFNVTQGTEEDELQALERGDRSLVLMVPDIDFNKVSQGQPIEIPVYYDASQSTTNQVLLPVIGQIFSQMEDMITGQVRIFEIQPQPMQTKELTDFDYILPGILAMSLMQLGLFGSLQFMNLREQKIIRGLGVTPLPRSTILSSEILLRVIVSLVQTFIIVAIGKLVFGVTIVGNILVLCGIVILGALTFTALGYMLIAFSKTLEAGRGIIQVVQFPMMFLSGTFFPITMMPKYIQPVVKAIPLTYLGDALRHVMVGATASYNLLTDLGILTAWLVVTLVLAIRFWKWE